MLKKKPPLLCESSSGQSGPEEDTVVPSCKHRMLLYLGMELRSCVTYLHFLVRELEFRKVKELVQDYLTSQ